jgi:hypothetical protein
MSLAHEQTVAEAPRPLSVLRYMSFDVVGTLIALKSVIKDRHAAIAAGAKLGSMMKRSSRFMLRPARIRRREYAASTIWDASTRSWLRISAFLVPKISVSS